eukprot:3425093-Prorocentrum_lima.AAC.1
MATIVRVLCSASDVLVLEAKGSESAIDLELHRRLGEVAPALREQLLCCSPLATRLPPIRC